MSYVIKQQGLKGGNLPRSGLLEQVAGESTVKRWRVSRVSAPALWKNDTVLHLDSL